MRGLLIAALLSAAGQAYAHQPVVDMAPRWSDGYGIQTRVENANAETTTWVEGVYTFKPSVRMTLKVPLGDDGIGDSIFAVPLKRYNNRKGFTSNWSLTPSVRIPTGQGNDWDLGASVSYSSETTGLYQLYDLYTLGDDIGFDLNVGRVFPSGKGTSWFTLWDVSVFDSRAGERVLTGPVVVYFKKNVVFRAEYKMPAYDRDTSWRGDFVSFTVGFVY